jgi:hypothetical protein
MSYILDALRRAESERARGQVPGLHDQPALPVGHCRARKAWPGIGACWLQAWAAVGTGCCWRHVGAVVDIVQPASPCAVVGRRRGASSRWPRPCRPSTPVHTPVAPAPTSAATPLLPQVVSAPAPVGAGIGCPLRQQRQRRLPQQTVHHPAGRTAARSTARVAQPRAGRIGLVRECGQSLRHRQRTTAARRRGRGPGAHRGAHRPQGGGAALARPTRRSAAVARASVAVSGRDHRHAVARQAQRHRLAHLHWRCTSGDTTKISPMAVAMVSSWKLPR